MRSGYQFIYEQAKLNLALYFPEDIFNQSYTILDHEKALTFKLVFQEGIPKWAGYIIHEFKVKGFLKEEKQGS